MVGKARHSRYKLCHMSLRYIVRRPDPQDLSEVKKVDSHLDKTLGPAAENLRRFIQATYNTSQYAVFHCMTTKVGESWTWTCPSVELVAETQSDFMELTERFHVPRTQLSHFPSRTA